MIYLLCLILFSVGLYGVFATRHLIRIIIGMSIIDLSLHLFLALIGYRAHGREPILDAEQEILHMVDPLPQALVLTAIVIGLAVTALMTAMAVQIHRKYGTFDIDKIRRLRG